ncbi:hypothetical protein [Metabacillus sp. RGM 3146]|uniref:hypothetical protein n=1 Tax=Metabacillus sp. RGM 3146 TaxID=3401092 RepID=UPI003B9A0F34
MKIKYFNDVDTVCEMESNDVAGVIAAVEKTDYLYFQEDVYKFEYFRFNHYLENNEWQEKLIVYMTND